MTKKYTETFQFTINNDNNLECYHLHDGQATKYQSSYAQELLSELDKLDISKVLIDNKRIIIRGDNTNIIINNYENFYLAGYNNSFNKHSRRIKKEIDRKGIIDAIKFKTKVGFTGTALASTLLISLLSVNNIAQASDNKVIETEVNYMEEEINPEDYIKNVKVEIEKIENNEIVKPIIEQIPVEEKINENDNIVNLSTLENNNEEIINNINEDVPYVSLNEAYLEAIKEVQEEKEIRESFTFEYNKEPDMEKMEHTMNYMDKIEKYAAKWGISPNIIYCMLAQETGGYNKNLLQIQFNSWKDTPITQYDFVNNRYQTIVLTNNPEKYRNKGMTCVTLEDLNKEETNISIGCFLYRTSVDAMDGHVLAGLQCYNYGQGAMNKVLNETSRRTNLTKDELLSDQSNSEFLEDTGILKNYGDKNYVKNVLTYFIDQNIPITMKFYDKENDEVIEKDIYITNKTKTL